MARKLQNKWLTKEQYKDMEEAIMSGNKVGTMLQLNRASCGRDNGIIKDKYITGGTL